MTVREAFAKAGHPVPDSGLIYKSSRFWFAVLPLVGCYDEMEFRSGWKHLNTYERNPRGLSPNLSNMPAKDCLSALPEVVRKVVEEA